MSMTSCVVKITPEMANNRSAMHVRDNCYPYNATLDA